MRLDSVLAFKQSLIDEAKGQPPEAFLARLGFGPELGDGGDEGARIYAETADNPMPEGIAVGIGHRHGGGPTDYHPVIVVEDEALGETMAARTAGEAVVRVVKVEPRIGPPVTARPSGEYARKRLRPLEPGLSVGVLGRLWSGTLGFFVQDATGTVYALSNSHVFADAGRIPLGAGIIQPGGVEDRTNQAENVIGVLERHYPLTSALPSKVDAALCRLRAVPFLPNFSAALGQPLSPKPHRLGPDDIDRRVVKFGRTTGWTEGRVRAVGIDGLTVDFGSGLKVRFNDQVEITLAPGKPFSQAGDSGSGIVVPETRQPCALLFAGGPGSDGIDYTYANQIVNVLAGLGVSIVARG